MESALRVSALGAVVALAIYLPMATKRVSKLRGVAGFSIPAAIANTTCALTAFVGFALCAAGVFPDRAAGLFLLGLVGLLGSSMVMFSRVIASMLRPHNEADDRPT